MIKNIKLSADGYIDCKSVFYTSHDTINSSTQFDFNTGINYLNGDIDSGIWGASYLLSMYNIDVNKKFFPNSSLALVDGKEMPIKRLTDYCCYLDEKMYPLFSSKYRTVRKLIEKGLKKSKKELSIEKIIDIFSLSSKRIDRPIFRVGNERFRAMSAVGYAYGKEIFCFPWLSRKMYNYYSNNILWLLDTLKNLNVITILPIGR